MKDIIKREDAAAKDNLEFLRTVDKEMLVRAMWVMAYESCDKDLTISHMLQWSVKEARSMSKKPEPCSYGGKPFGQQMRHIPWERDRTGAKVGTPDEGI